MAYPQTGISTSQTTETMKMQLRVYLGACIYEPENILLLPDVQFEGAVAGHGANFCKERYFDPQYDDLIIAFKDKKSDLQDIFSDKHFKATAGQVYYKEYFDLEQRGDLEGEDEPTGKRGQGFNSEDGVPLSLYQGTVMKQNNRSEWVCHTENTGHLGCLDHPEASDRLDGIQKYSRVPCPTGPKGLGFY